MLRRFVSPSVLTAVIDSQEDLHAETGSTELLTILFSEIDSFTNISESLDAGKVVALLNIYLSDMTDVLFNHDGTLDKFIGEVIMAFWGAPVKTPNHPRLALECAIDMCRRLRQTNKLLTDNNYPSIDIGIGIHSGEVVLGNIGSEKISGYTVVGDNVNLASRLKGLSKIYGSPIIISETTWQAVRTSISCIRLDRVRVHGRLKPIDLYAPAKLFLESNNLQISEQTLQQDVAYAFDLFLQRDWKSAAESYSHLGECVLSNLFKERCLQYQAIDPGQKWDGVFVGSTK
jgi:adenylate cyclase